MGLVCFLCAYLRITVVSKQCQESEQIYIVKVKYPVACSSPEESVREDDVFAYHAKGMFSIFG